MADENQHRAVRLAADFADTDEWSLAGYSTAGRWIADQLDIKERDRVCIDCGSHDLLQYDHVPDFDKSRRTVVDELELRCATCHRFRHATDAAG